MNKPVSVPMVMATVCLAIAGFVVAQAGEQPSECLVTLKTYIISGVVGQVGVSFPVYPRTSLAEVEETINSLDEYYEKLRSLYAFTEYRLLTTVSQRVRLVGYPHPSTIMLKTDSTTPSSEWNVEARDFGWDTEGRLQMLLKITRDSAPFVETRLSVLPGHSAVLGSFTDQNMKEAIFAVVVPDIDVAAVGEAASTPKLEPPPAGQSGQVGLPPAEPERAEPAQEPADPLADKPFVEVAEYPVLLTQTPPEYPEAAKREQAEGNVWLRSLIDESGNVSQCEVARTSGRADLDSAAVRSGRMNKFTPARDKNGKLVSIWVAYKVSFKLK